MFFMITVKERELIVQWYEDGKCQQEIAGLLGCNQSSVSRFIAKYNHTGLLRNLPRSGRPTKLTKKNQIRLKEKILSEIREANNEFCCVSTKEVGKIIKREIGKSYSLRHVERIMHNLGFSLITPRPQHVRHDQKKVDRFRDEFKKKFNRSMWAMN